MDVDPEPDSTPISMWYVGIAHLLPLPLLENLSSPSAEEDMDEVIPHPFP